MTPADQADRESKPARSVVETDKQARARLEAANGVRQTDFMFTTIDRALAGDGVFKLRPSLLGELNRLAVNGLTRSSTRKRQRIEPDSPRPDGRQHAE